MNIPEALLAVRFQARDSDGVEAAVHWVSGPQFSDRLITRWTCSVPPTDTDTVRRCSWHTEWSHDEARIARYRVQFT